MRHIYLDGDCGRNFRGKEAMPKGVIDKAQVTGGGGSRGMPATRQLRLRDESV